MTAPSFAIMSGLVATGARASSPATVFVPVAECLIAVGAGASSPASVFVPIASGLVAALGLGYGVWYLVRSLRASGPAAATGQRPWRRLGAALCGLLAITFFIGVNFVDPSRAPAAYLLLWILVLLGILWLCGLAMVDILYTRRHHREALRSLLRRGDARDDHHG